MKSNWLHYLLLGVVCMTAQAADGPVGYTDTPLIPGQKWRDQDKNRPIPKVVTPGTTFRHSAPAPSDAIILFDGKDLSKWRNGNKPATWKVENGYMEVTPGSGSIQTKDDFGDFQLHLEFATPHKVVEVMAEPVENVVDTTGAGDLYAAGVLHGLTQGFELDVAGRIGSICAAEVISHYGARPEVSLEELVREKIG